MEDIQRIIETLSPNEKKILPYLEEKKIDEICKKSQLDKVSVIRSLEYLQNKKIITLEIEKKKIVEIGLNGALYRKKGLPERRLLNLLNEKRIIRLEEAKKQSALSDDEFKASIGALKNKAMIELSRGNIILSANREEIAKKFLEEQFIDALPLELHSLSPEQFHALKSLQNRKNMLEIKEVKQIKIKLTEIGKEILKKKIETKDIIEQLTPEIIKNGSWKGKKFRRYDVTSPVHKINGGKRHFVNQATDYARKIWTEMGFKEMTGNMIVSSFWNFDALFTAQDHPVREMQDTFFIDKKTELPDKKIVKLVRQAHESGVDKSKGWNYSWSEEEAKRLVLRTHTTVLSAQTLAKLKEIDLPAKFFAVGKCFRNETIDINHLFELTQTEGIVVGNNLTLRNLIGYLKQFYKKMGFEQIRIRPSYFPYTEPSLEIDVYDSKQKKWIELGGAGIFRPEVVIPIFGKYITVLAWGQGFERIIRNYFSMGDLRGMYRNNLSQLRKEKFWVK